MSLCIFHYGAEELIYVLKFSASYLSGNYHGTWITAIFPCMGHLELYTGESTLGFKILSMGMAPVSSNNPTIETNTGSVSLQYLSLY